MNIDYKTLRTRLLPLLILTIITILYFLPQLQGKVVVQGDIVSSSQAQLALRNYEKENNKTYLWNPAQFGGMPVLAHAPAKNNIARKIYPALKLGFAEPIGLFLAGGILSYIMFLFLGLGPWTSMIFSFAALYATDNILLWEAGHNSKIRTLIFTPLLIMGLLSIFEKRKYLLGFIVLAVGFSFSFYTRHPQMTYYILLIFGIYGIAVLVDVIKEKDWMHLGKGVVAVVAALGLSLLTSASKTWSLYDYSKSTMRGDAILSSGNVNNAQSSSEVDGLDWEYATRWSNDYKDIMASYIPGFVGGSGAEKVSTKSQSFKNYKIKQAPLYWGNLPFTGGPFYFGASVIFIFVLALFWVKGRVKWWLGLAAFFMIVLSMGKNIEWFNKFLFDYLPFYSKFRAPQTITNTSSYFLALMAALGIGELLRLKVKSKKKTTKAKIKDFEKGLFIGYGLCGGLALIIALVGSSFFDFSGAGDGRYIQQGVDISAFVEDRKSLFRSDAWRSFLIVTLIGGLVFTFLRAKISSQILIAGIGAIIIIDLIGIDLRYLSHGDYVKKKANNSFVDDRPVDKVIKANENNRELYRVHDLTIDPFNSSRASVAHNTIGGYSPAKMQRAQDLIERHISKNNINVLNMLNAKYFITNGEDGQPTVQRNPDALGVAWFVDNVKIVNTPNEEIDALSNTDLKSTAIVLDQEFGNYIRSLVPGIGGTVAIQMTNYEPDILTYESNNSEEGLAIFSEMWYGPNKGWQAYIDGTPVDHIRANYALRALKIPAGKHEIKFEFRPAPFYKGEMFSLVGSAILVLSLLGIAYLSYRRELA